MYEKTQDMLKLVEMLQSRADGVAIDEIQQKFAVSLRTAQRMCSELSTIFPTMEAIMDGKKKRWRIPRSSMTPLFTLFADELAALTNCINYLKQHNQHEQANLLTQLAGKISHVVQSSKRTQSLLSDIETRLNIEGLAFRPGPRFCVNEHIIKSLRQSLLAKLQIRIKYYNKKTKKYSYNQLNPYGILYSDKEHYLLAHHSDGYYGDAIHHFIIRHIVDVTVLEQAAVIPTDFSLTSYCQDMFGVFKEDPFDVEWLFSADVADEVKHYVFHPSQKMRENDDGSITVKFRAGGAVEMSWYLYMWGDMVEVIEPIDFWQRVESY